MLMFGLFEMIFPVVFLTVFAMVLFTFIRGIAEWNKNNHSPRLTVPAKVTGKRQNTTHHRHPNAGDVSGAHGYHTTSNTAYYVTFQVDSGDRLELSVLQVERSRIGLTLAIREVTMYITTSFSYVLLRLIRFCFFLPAAPTVPTCRRCPPER